MELREKVCFDAASAGSVMMKMSFEAAISQHKMIFLALTAFACVCVCVTKIMQK